MTEPQPLRRFPAQRLRDLIRNTLVQHDMAAEDAAEVARLMIEADLLGGDGHGIFRLPRYLDRIRAGGLNMRPDIRVERAKGSMALVDGDNAMGHLVMKRCAEEAIRIAGAQGIGWVGAHHSNHAGAAGVYARMALEHGMIGIYLAVGNANHMAPWGGIDLLLSTNPIAVAIPAMDRPPILLDMATTVAAYGKVKMAAQRGEAMPEGWMIDAAGHPLTDPGQAGGGSLLPIGGPKGYGLSLVFGLLAGTLNGAAMGRDLVDFNADDVTVTNTGQCVVMIDIAAFGDPARFRGDVDRIIDEMKGSALRPGFDGIRLPGERALSVHAERSRDGIPLPEPLIALLNGVAADHSLPGLE